ncbi:Uncharacterised protein [Mycobacteroides abscessus subsp. abscessus]|nr:Uncharacterised protein [Mycobacteroides abscessus subsp. abscessus]
MVDEVVEVTGVRVDHRGHGLVVEVGVGEPGTGLGHLGEGRSRLRRPPLLQRRRPDLEGAGGDPGVDGGDEELEVARDREGEEVRVTAGRDDAGDAVGAHRHVVEDRRPRL